MQVRLVLEDGTCFVGKSFGSEQEKIGEVVFNTSMTGYQEVLSDPSYCGQIVTMTYPLIGNYGIARDDFESVRPNIFGLVVREQELVPSNWRAEYTLDHLLKEYEIPGIYGIDTRMLTRRIRQHGTMKAILTTSDESVEDLLLKINAASLLTDQVDRVSTKATYSVPGSGKRVVLVDYGSKSGILRDLTERGCDTVVVPYTATAGEIRHLHPDGILLSNGPGDPKSIPQAVETVRQLIGEIPIFGICLGHQIFALACGANTEKMKFGHRGANHPVKDLLHNRCYITSQNHGYTVTSKTIAGTPLEVTHINNNDESIEGLRHKEAAAFSVQYHPEAAPGPYDSDYLFDEFLNMMDEFREKNPKKPQQEKLWSQAKQKGVKHLAEKY